MIPIVVQPEVIKKLVDCIVDVIQNKIDWNSIDWQAVAENQRKNDWIPITFREADDEEYEDYIGRNDYIPREECKIYDCHMPDDGQAVLITTSWGCVCEDIFHADLDDFGFEDHYDPDEVIAWMPKPEPYKKGGAEE